MPETAEEDVLDRSIVKTGVKLTFTLSQLKAESEKLKGMATEARAKMDYEIARMKNVESYHEDAISLVKGLDPVKQNAIHIWLDAKSKLDQYGPVKDRIVEQLKHNHEDLKDIIEQTGIELPEDFNLPDPNGEPTKKENGEEDSQEDGESSRPESS